MGHTDEQCQQQQQQQQHQQQQHQQQLLERSYSFELPMELKRIHMNLPSIDDLSPRLRHSLTESTSRPRTSTIDSNRSSLHNSDRKSHEVDAVHSRTIKGQLMIV
jgi:transcription initiation factor TFIID subunit TAF12